MRCLRLVLLAALVAISANDGDAAPSVPETTVPWTAEIPAPLIGPYIIDPATLMELDSSGTGCAQAGPLNFQCLVFRDSRSSMTASDLASNPFTIPIFKQVLKTVQGDLTSIGKHEEYGGKNARGLQAEFLTYPGARIELVGVINRMDRQFNRDIVPGHGKRLACGEISAIYRFGYEGDIGGGAAGKNHYQSRLPVTMNVVFPATPWSGGPDCAEVARRWLDYAHSAQDGPAPSLLREKALRIVSSLKPEDIDRIELNMQGSRVSAGADTTDFGTLGTYIIRVFRWVPHPKGGLWEPSYLTNQIDRARLAGLPGDENTCANMWGKGIDKRHLVRYLLSMNSPGEGPNAVGDIDNGLLNIPQPFLACRAISISPGGASRSGNQQFWGGASAAEQLISDQEIEAAIRRYKRLPQNSLSFIGSAEEFRSRLNEASCSGCHQTRAIAGFHFPGADRPGVSPVNAVYLPGSPHFFGDQPRRMEILAAIAKGETLTFPALATSYAARPLNRFAALKPQSDPAVPSNENIQLIGGWGGTCMKAAPHSADVRKWGCAGNLICQPLFQSVTQPGIGVCMNPPNAARIGEAMQTGVVTSSRFGSDMYTRTTPPIPPSKPRDTTINTDTLSAPLGNSFAAAHQEFYEGIGGLDPRPGESKEQHARRVRDQETGGFPAGALRLSECVGLPSEATCGLLASSGFNACLDKVGDGQRTPDNCFGIYTSYSGVRACDAANPCRDDYICMSPMGYTAANAKAMFDARAARREAARTSKAESEDNRKRLGITFFGEKMPDQAWLSRNGGNGDRRGLCIPPYFVFQFKADGHRVPAMTPLTAADQ